jgi:hypothetical protein
MYCGLLYDAVSILDYMESSGRMTDKLWIGNDAEGNSRGRIKVLPGHLPGWTEKNHEKTQSVYAVACYRHSNLLCDWFYNILVLEY